MLLPVPVSGAKLHDLCGELSVLWTSGDSGAGIRDPLGGCEFLVPVEGHFVCLCWMREVHSFMGSGTSIAWGGDIAGLEWRVILGLLLDLGNPFSMGSLLTVLFFPVWGSRLSTSVECLWGSVCPQPVTP